MTRLANVNPYLIGGTYSAGRPIDMLANVLNLDELRVEPAFVIDKLNEAIGTYRVDQRKSLWRAFSPVFWIARVIEYVAQSLVRFFSSILGFDQEKALGSKPGRILTQLFQTTIWLFTLVQGLAALSYLLDHFGWEIPLLHWFRFK